MATFRRLPSGSWQAVIRRKGIKPLAKTFIIKTDAERWARSQEIKLDQGIFTSQAEIEQTTFAELIDRYKTEITPTKKGATQEGYKFNYIRAELGHLLLIQIKTSHIAAFRDKRLKAGIAGATLVRDLNLIASVFNTAIKEWSLPLAENPAKQVKRPPKAPGRERRLNLEEWDKVLSCLSETKGVTEVVQLLLATGMRRGELLSAQWQHINLEDRFIFLPDSKNGQSRRVPLSTAAVRILETLPKTGDRLFNIRPQSVSQAFARACRRAGIADLRLHDLRHECVSRLFEKGLNVMEVSAVSGHRTLNMLQRYTHLRESDIALKLG